MTVVDSIREIKPIMSETKPPHMKFGAHKSDKVLHPSIIILLFHLQCKGHNSRVNQSTRKVSQFNNNRNQVSNATKSFAEMLIREQI